jgi:ATP-dependent DNA helicase RecQ
VLYYSWADVLSLDRLLENADVQNAEVAGQQRRAVRSMFGLADDRGCLWSRLTGHFAEVMPACGTSCGYCLGREAGADRLASIAPSDSADRRRPRPAAEAPASAIDARRSQTQSPSDESGDATADPELYRRLRALRKSLADGRKVPAFVVFGDRTLLEMAARKPRTRDEFLELFGVGQKKLDEYGDAFLAEIRRR